MRKFRIIGMIMVAVLMCANFTSCRLIETTRSSLFDMSLVWEDNKLITLKNKNTMLGTTRTFMT